MQLSIVGVLTEKRGPVSPQVVFFKEGVNALYGVNGSGKSFFLEMVADYVKGSVWADGGLLLKWRDPEEPTLAEDGFFLIQNESALLGIEGSWGQELRRQEIYAALLESPYRDPVLRVPSQHGDDWRGGSMWKFRTVDDSEHGRALIDEVLDHGFLLAQPQRTDPATWAIWPMAFPSSETPLLNQELEVHASLVATIERTRQECLVNEELDLDAFWDAIGEFNDDGFDIERSLIGCSKNLPYMYDEIAPLEFMNCGAVFLRSIGDLAQGNWVQLVDGVQARHSDVTVSAAVMDLVRQVLIPGGSGRLNDVEGQELVQQRAKVLGDTASAVLSDLLLDSFTLELDVGTLMDLVAGTHPRWVATQSSHQSSDDVTSTQVQIKDLSRAQRRWSEFAIGVACQSLQVRNSLKKYGPRLWVIDEPENALHRAAEEHLADGLVILSERFNVTIIVATHSPEILDSVKTRVLHAQKIEGKTSLAPMEEIERESLAELGLRPSDLLRRQRVFVLVEGEHEVLILNELFAQELRGMRAQLLPTRGGRNFEAVIDSQFLFAFSDAAILITMDNQNAAEIQEVWAEARSMAQRNALEQAGEFLRSRLRGEKSENVFFREFGSKAITAGLHERIEAFGFSLPDILEYLPIQFFCKHFDSWEDARAAYKESGSNVRNLKEWIGKAHGGDLSRETILRATQSMDAIPADFTGFLEVVSALSNQHD